MTEETLIQMWRPQPAEVGGPVTAEVHPDEVANYMAGGWQVVVVSEKSPDDDPDKGKGQSAKGKK